MNPTIIKIIDMMFREVPENQETAAIREELLTNSQARYDDLIAAGENPDTALGQVLDNLRGMEDVLAEYKTASYQSDPQESADPFARFERLAEELDDKWDHFTDKAESTAKSAFDSAMAGLRSAMKSVAGIFDKTAPQTSQPRWQEPSSAAAPSYSWQPVDDDELSVAFAPNEISRINIQMTAEDINLEPSSDGRVHIGISKADEDLYQVNVHNGTLSIRHKPLLSAATSSPENEQYQGLGGMITGIGNAVRSAIQSLRTTGDSLNLLVPDHLEQLTLQTTSGDILVEDLRQKSGVFSATSGVVELRDCIFTGPVQLNATSGDLDLCRSVFESSLSLNATSGDIELSVNAPKLVVNTTSGDAELTGDLPDIEANTVSGDLEMRITGDVRQLKANSVSGDISIALPYSASPTVRTNTQTGDVSIGCATSEGPVPNVMLSSVSGDLTLNNF